MYTYIVVIATTTAADAGTFSMQYYGRVYDLQTVVAVRKIIRLDIFTFVGFGYSGK